MKKFFAIPGIWPLDPSFHIPLPLINSVIFKRNKGERASRYCLQQQGSLFEDAKWTATLVWRYLWTLFWTVIQLLHLGINWLLNMNPLFWLMGREMAAHSNIVAWRILWMEEPGRLLSIGSHRVRHDWGDLACMHACIGGGNGNPLQYSCLENPRDRGAWWAAVYGVTQSRTRLKWLSSSSSSNEIRTFLELYLMLQ